MDIVITHTYNSISDKLTSITGLTPILVELAEGVPKLPEYVAII